MKGRKNITGRGDAGYPASYPPVVKAVDSRVTLIALWDKADDRSILFTRFSVSFFYV